MQNARSNQNTYRGGRPQYRVPRWTPPPEPKPEPKLDLSDRNFPTLSNQPVAQTAANQHDFQTAFSTTVKVMAEVEKLNDLREERNRLADQKARAEMGGVYTHRFQPGRMSERNEEEAPWEPPKRLEKPDDTVEWVEVRHSKARRQPREKTTRELAEEYRAKAIDEEHAEDYNGDLFESSHRHDHHAT
jgi:hypothetical protein